MGSRVGAHKRIDEMCPDRGARKTPEVPVNRSGWGNGASRSGNPRRLRTVAAATVAVAAVGFYLPGSGAAAERKPGDDPKARLAQLVAGRQRDLVTLEHRLDQAEARLRRVRRSDPRTTVRDRRRLVAPLAEATRVIGPGIEVVLDDGKGPSRDPAIDDARRIHDLDLQLLVNALWAAGAEAVAVNRERLAATTAIRGAGETITVNFRPQGPPYRIRAIGAEQGAFSRSPTAGRFRRWSELFGLRFETRSRSRLDLPAHRPALRARYARPEADGTAWIRPG
ncbi:MAG: DUF881 domain-containing protein [Acidimicrobiia bacterium]